ncbi:hypothetical protein OROMI_024635 [Orobanche minor]
MCSLGILGVECGRVHWFCFHFPTFSGPFLDMKFYRFGIFLTNTGTVGLGYFVTNDLDILNGYNEDVEYTGESRESKELGMIHEYYEEREKCVLEFEQYRFFLATYTNFTVFDLV